MQSIVITGSTRGIGRGLADAFLDLGCAVTVSGRAQARVQQAVAELSTKYGSDRVHGHPCDVRALSQVQVLWNAAEARWGRIDIWINNAGVSHFRADFWELAPDQIDAVVATNLLGTMFGSRVAMRGMLAQGSGSLYNMEGFGSDGRKMNGLTLYGTTKRAVRYFSRSLTQEAKGTPIKVGTISPGMVVTDLLTAEFAERPEAWDRAKRIFNILADRIETVTPWLAKRILANAKTGARIAWLTRTKAIWRFLTAGMRKRDLFG